MYFSGNGMIFFDDIYELYYNLFTTMGLAVNNKNYLYDQDSSIPIKFKDKYVKATVQPVIIYPGMNEILFDPARNYQLMVSLFGYYLDKNADTIPFIAQYIDEDKETGKQALCVKTANGNIRSHFYKNGYLGYIECIFLLSGDYVTDLSNFDLEVI